MSKNTRYPEGELISTDGFVGDFHIDAAGVPFYKWPPWPATPPGTRIVPFTSFVALGISAVSNAFGQEVDGLGIPTASIVVAHYGGGDKKNRHGGRSENGGRPPAWNEVWAEADRLAPVRKYDQRNTPQARLLHAISEFQRSRRWTPQLQSVFDAFRQFLGIAINPNQKTPALSSDDYDDEDEDGSDSESDASPLESEHATSLSALMMNRFLARPERATKIFLSSYSSRVGILWVHGKVLAAPLLLRLFLEYLLKHSVLPESRLELRDALAVTDIASVDLPGTWRASQALAGERFGMLCSEALSVSAAGAGLTDADVIVDLPGLDDDEGWYVDRGQHELLATLPPGSLASLRRTFVEVSCRRVVRIMPPDPTKGVMRATFGTIILAPWDGPFSRDIQPPRVILADCSDDPSPVGDSIRVLVDPEILPDLTTGIGLLGTWVRVESPSSYSQLSPVSVDDQASCERVWWFIEQITGTIPSFWENDEFE